MRRVIAAATLALLGMAGVAGTASAHPLGNYTVNRAVAVTVAADGIGLTYVLDMAEIPAFAEIDAIDVDGDGGTSAAESQAYARITCERIRSRLDLRLDGAAAVLAPGSAPQLSFPDGAGGLRTLRLVCSFRTELGGAARHIAVNDRTDDGHVGWREVTIVAGSGVRLISADVPSRSESGSLTSYPGERLQTPPDVRQGHASFERTRGVGDATISGPTSPWRAPTDSDPLAGLVGGELSPAVVLVAVLLAAGLGAAHALSPGHGKTLVAAYLVGSRGSVRQAAALGLTVAVTHTAGVLVLGVLVLMAGELFLPEVVIGWLTVASGGLMAGLGAALLVRAVARRTGHAHPDHDHQHQHAHGRGQSHTHAPADAAPTLTVRGIALLGVAGGLVPSASALIVLLAAVTTGRLAYGLALITAFGAGMAAVLGGLAVATTLARGWLNRRAAGHARLTRVATIAVPIGSGLIVLGIGLVIAITAVTRLA